MFWFPTLREDRYLNVIAGALVLLLLSLGFEILKLPTNVSPDRPPLPQAVGFCALVMLNAIIMWSSARDDFVRTAVGLRKVAMTLLLFTSGASAAFLIRGTWDGTYAIDVGERIDRRQALTIAIGGQFVIMIFLAVYFLKKADGGAVRQFKRSANLARPFLADWLGGKIRDPADFNARFQAMSATLAAMPQSAQSAAELLPPAEADYAKEVGSFYGEVWQYISTRPDAMALKNGRSFVKGKEQLVEKTLGARTYKRIADGPAR
jgi:hypothetical protein